MGDFCDYMIRVLYVIWNTSGILQYLLLGNEARWGRERGMITMSDNGGFPHPHNKCIFLVIHYPWWSNGLPVGLY